MSDFQLAIAKLLAKEGGYVNHPHDRGGETNYGISQRAYPHLTIATLTKDQAIAIYRQDYWGRYGEIESQAIAETVFEMAVNAGSRVANRLLQRAINRCGGNIAEDGLIGPNTLNATNALPESHLLAQLKLELIRYYVQLVEANQTQRVFLLGWLKRALA